MKRMFEFECQTCNGIFTKLVKDDIKTGIECKLCKSYDTKRIVSATKGFQFNGSGFYETDYKNK